MNPPHKVLLNSETYSPKEKIHKIMIMYKEKLAKSFKMNFNLWLSSVNLIGFDFHDFLILIESIFEFQIIFKYFFVSAIWFEIYLFNKKS